MQTLQSGFHINFGNADVTRLFEGQKDHLIPCASQPLIDSDLFLMAGGRRRLKEGTVPVLFVWNDYTLPAVRTSVWDRIQRPEDESTEEEEMDVGLLLQCHDYDAKPEPSALDIACEKIEVQQQVIEELQKTMAEVTLKQSFGLERFLASDDDIRFYPSIGTGISNSTRTIGATHTPTSFDTDTRSRVDTGNWLCCYRCIPVIVIFLSMTLTKVMQGTANHLFCSQPSSVSEWFYEPVLQGIGRISQDVVANIHPTNISGVSWKEVATAGQLPQCGQS
ncbi:hypothetical protein DPEC_G00246930 [Dallia pectoralis]|uniref:Uncharacterized protein n=1 Tax=Dallia pectoralis TaxID=75939 RepID=A0ACC2FWD9_DALPE|nr:hypothetical protein DPEC_G00246930 [Dallia pectoralis]